MHSLVVNLRLFDVTKLGVDLNGDVLCRRLVGVAFHLVYLHRPVRQCRRRVGLSLNLIHLDLGVGDGGRRELTAFCDVNLDIYALWNTALHPFPLGGIHVECHTNGLVVNIRRFGLFNGVAD